MEECNCVECLLHRMLAEGLARKVDCEMMTLVEGEELSALHTDSLKKTPIQQGNP